ncbi:hypothetical protein [Salinimicrobium gaetbulicola]|uniref:Secreted protein with PEP-CTERM sorting signal n=1 Tax=Salinimicrobium gaetbulicola TaxID=999702 RepID=A0ABW3IGC7_9FLAO
MKYRILFTIIALVVVSFDATAQCAMCRAVLESEASQSAAEGINDGIMYLMIFPYLLMGGVAYFIWRSRKNSKAGKNSADL